MNFSVYCKYAFLTTHQCCRFGSESGSTCFWASWIRIRIHVKGMDPDPDPDPSITKREKNKKKLDSYCFVTSFWPFIFKNDVQVPSESNKPKKNFFYLFFVGIFGRSMTKIAGSGPASGSIRQRHGSADPDPDPDPPQNVMDPQHCYLPLISVYNSVHYRTVP